MFVRERPPRWIILYGVLLTPFQAYPTGRPQRPSSRSLRGAGPLSGSGSRVWVEGLRASSPLGLWRRG